MKSLYKLVTSVTSSAKNEKELVGAEKDSLVIRLKELQALLDEKSTNSIDYSDQIIKEFDAQIAAINAQLVDHLNIRVRDVTTNHRDTVSDKFDVERFISDTNTRIFALENYLLTHGRLPLYRSLLEAKNLRKMEQEKLGQLNKTESKVDSAKVAALKIATDNDQFIYCLGQMKQTIADKLQSAKANDAKEVVVFARALEKFNVELETLQRTIDEKISERKKQLSGLSTLELTQLDKSKIEELSYQFLEDLKKDTKRFEDEFLASMQIGLYQSLTEIIGDHALWSQHANQLIGGKTILVSENNKDKTVHVPSVIEKMIKNLANVEEQPVRRNSAITFNKSPKSPPININKMHEQKASTATVATVKLKELKKIADARLEKNKGKKDYEKSFVGQFCKLVGSISEDDFSNPMQLGAHITAMKAKFSVNTSRRKTLQAS